MNFDWCFNCPSAKLYLKLISLLNIYQFFFLARLPLSHHVSHIISSKHVCCTLFCVQQNFSHEWPMTNEYSGLLSGRPMGLLSVRWINNNRTPTVSKTVDNRCASRSYIGPSFLSHGRVVTAQPFSSGICKRPRKEGLLVFSSLRRQQLHARWNIKAFYARSRFYGQPFGRDAIDER